MGCEVLSSVLEQTPAMNGKITEISRRGLYEKVWSRSVSSLAKEIGISDVGLAKICKHYNIPMCTETSGTLVLKQLNIFTRVALPLGPES